MSLININLDIDREGRMIVSAKYDRKTVVDLPELFQYLLPDLMTVVTQKKKKNITFIIYQAFFVFVFCSKFKTQ